MFKIYRPKSSQYLVIFEGAKSKKGRQKSESKYRRKTFILKDIAMKLI